MQSEQHQSGPVQGGGNLCAAVITLIHGTFARDAPWTLETSPLCKSLAGSAEGDIRFEQFTWSGRNRIADRKQAAKDLASFLKEQRQRYGQSPQIVVGHSHGGSVLGYLLGRNHEIAQTVAGAAFLATPFVEARARADWPLVATITLVAFVMCLSAAATAALMLAMSIADAAGNRTFSTSIFIAWGGLIIFATPALLIAYGRPSAIAARYDLKGVVSLGVV